MSFSQANDKAMRTENQFACYCRHRRPHRGGSKIHRLQVTRQVHIFERSVDQVVVVSEDA